MEEAINEVNSSLAESCQKACSSCCKMGLLFLPIAEHDAIVKWVKERSPGEIDEFERRLQKHDGFYLYNQESKCQFLDDLNLCRLHNEGVKPSECFWWPLHVYVSEEDRLQLRVSTSCCNAYLHINEGSSLLKDVEDGAERIGFDVIRRFRKEYKGSYNNRLLKEVSE